LGELGFFADRAAPVAAGFLFLAEGHQGVAEVEQGFGELRIFIEGLLIEADGVLRLALLLADEAGVVEELGAVFNLVR
jgi:hypothetical protein